MNDLIQNIEQKIKILAQKCRDLEAENEVLKEEVEELKKQRDDAQSQEMRIPTSAVLDSRSEAFELSLKRAKTAKRELELYLRDMERKIEGIKF